MLLEAKVPFGRATSSVWNIVNTDVKMIPDNALLKFDPELCVIKMIYDSKETDILQCETLNKKEIDYVKGIIDDPTFVQKIQPYYSNVAEDILAVEVEPSFEWRNWIRVMKQLKPELIIVLSDFRYKVNLLPEIVPKMSALGYTLEAKLNTLAPRDSPEIDWAWINKGTWEKFIQ